MTVGVATPSLPPLVTALHVRVVLKKFKKNAILDNFDGGFTEDSFDFSMVNLIKFTFIVNIFTIF